MKQVPVPMFFVFFVSLQRWYYLEVAPIETITDEKKPEEPVLMNKDEGEDLPF